MAFTDVPTILKYIYTITGKQINYVGRYTQYYKITNLITQKQTYYYIELNNRIDVIKGHSQGATIGLLALQNKRNLR